MAIKLVALDLDGTTLDRNGRLSRGNAEVLKEASDRGVNIVVATGRPFCALPEDILGFAPERYVLTSNGARITDLATGRAFYENCLSPHAVEAACRMLKPHSEAERCRTLEPDSSVRRMSEPPGVILETFVDGVAYIEGWYFREVERTRRSFKSVDYILNTRKPRDSFYEFMLENRDRIENINVNLTDISVKPQMREKLLTLPDVTITSSFDHNLEIGGATTSKAEALRQMCRLLDISTDEMMAVGDSPNDMAMMEAAGVAVAVGNAKDEVKAIADFIAPPNYEDGVATAVRKYCLPDSQGK